MKPQLAVSFPDKINGISLVVMMVEGGREERKALIHGP